MIDYNAGTVRDGYVRPTDESAPDLSQGEMDEVERHCYCCQSVDCSISPFQCSPNQCDNCGDCEFHCCCDTAEGIAKKEYPW